MRTDTADDRGRPNPVARSPESSGEPHATDRGKPAPVTLADAINYGADEYDRCRTYDALHGRPGMRDHDFRHLR